MKSGDVHADTVAWWLYVHQHEQRMSAHHTRASSQDAPVATGGCLHASARSCTLHNISGVPRAETVQWGRRNQYRNPSLVPIEEMIFRPATVQANHLRIGRLTLEIRLAWAKLCILVLVLVQHLYNFVHIAIDADVLYAIRAFNLLLCHILDSLSWLRFVFISHKNNNMNTFCCQVFWASISVLTENS